jgi:hypothetical protein
VLRTALYSSLVFRCEARYSTAPQRDFTDTEVVDITGAILADPLPILPALKRDFTAPNVRLHSTEWRDFTGTNGADFNVPHTERAI